MDARKPKIIKWIPEVCIGKDFEYVYYIWNTLKKINHIYHLQFFSFGVIMGVQGVAKIVKQVPCILHPLSPSGNICVIVV